MKIKGVLFVLMGAGMVFCGCTTGSPATVDRSGNTRPVLQGTAPGAASPGAAFWKTNSSMFQPTYNRDGSITVFSNRNFHLRIMPMTDGRTRGALNQSTEEFDVMIARYEDILRENPNDYEACIMLAGLHIDRDRPGDAEKTIEYSNRALAINHNDPQALYARGIAHSESGNNLQALNDLTAVLRADIQSMKGVYYIMGKIHDRAGNLDEALQAFEAVRAMDPDFADIEEVIKELRRLTS